jgi:hypothetical protein
MRPSDPVRPPSMRICGRVEAHEQKYWIEAKTSRPDASPARMPRIPARRPGGHQAGGPGGWSVEAPPETPPPAGPAIGFDMVGGDPSRPQFAPDHLAADSDLLGDIGEGPPPSGAARRLPRLRCRTASCAGPPGPRPACGGAPASAGHGRHRRAVPAWSGV